MGTSEGKRAEVVKPKSQQANQELGINKQIEQEEVLPSAAYQISMQQNLVCIISPVNH